MICVFFFLVCPHKWNQKCLNFQPVLQPYSPHTLDWCLASLRKAWKNKWVSTLVQPDPGSSWKLIKPFYSVQQQLNRFQLGRISGAEHQWHFLSLPTLPQGSHTSIPSSFMINNSSPFVLKMACFCNQTDEVKKETPKYQKQESKILLTFLIQVWRVFWSASCNFCANIYECDNHPYFFRDGFKC